MLKKEMPMKVNKLKLYRLAGICLLLAFWAALYGCSSFNRTVPTSGFLKDYSKLREGKGDQALLVYINREVNFHIYDKVMIDPVSIIFSKDSKMAKLSDQDRQKMANYFHAALEENLSNDYIIASKPGSLTMRLRFALTDITESQAVKDTVSNSLSIDSALDQITSTATGSHAYLGDATAEMEILDSMTGQRLAAAVDRRSGVWNNVKDACDFWAQRVTRRLEEYADGDYLLER
jgi:hypothetical protein